MGIAKNGGKQDCDSEQTCCFPCGTNQGLVQSNDLGCVLAVSVGCVPEEEFSMTPDMMRLLIAVYMMGVALLAVLFLRRREMSLLAYTFWGLVALMFPLVGPFVVLYLRPGGRQ
jgi:hypothetical protein